MRIQTVTGPLEPEDTGFILPAEHIYIQQWWQIPGRESLWQIEDDDVFADEIAAFQHLGGTCLVDTTPPCIGRKPARLRALSERTGLSIVMACGWYIEAYNPPEDHLDRRSVHSIAEQLIAEIERGVDDTGIRPGIIGEFGATSRWISPVEERVHRASARAHRATGIPLSTHAIHSEVGLDQLDLFDEEDVNPGKVSIGHCDSWPILDYWLAIASRGAYVQLDNIGQSMGRHEERLANLVCAMVDRGYERHVLLSHDLGLATELRYYGGRGFTYLFDVFLPLLRDRGIPDEVITTLTVDNPRRFLTMD